MNLPYRTMINSSSRVDPLDQWLSEQPTDPCEIQKWAARMPMQEPVTPPGQQREQSDDSYKRLRLKIEALEREVAELRRALETQRNECWHWTTEIADETGQITGREAARLDKIVKRLDAIAKPKAAVA